MLIVTIQGLADCPQHYAIAARLASVVKIIHAHEEGLVWPLRGATVDGSSPVVFPFPVSAFWPLFTQKGSKDLAPNVTKMWSSMFA